MDTRNRHWCKWEQQQACDYGHQRSAKDDGAFPSSQSCACVFNPFEQRIRKMLCEPGQENQDCQGDEGKTVHESLFLLDLSGRVRYRLQN